MSNSNPPLEPSDVIASRQLEVVDEEGRVVSFVSVWIGKPWQVSENEWSCYYRVMGLDEDCTLRVSGFDALQALQGVFVVVDGHLAGLDNGRCCLRWNEQMDLGFVPRSHYPNKVVQ
jgi:hypothetical protein